MKYQFTILGKIKNISFRNNADIITIETKRNYKNEFEEYESDNLRVYIPREDRQNIKKYGQEGQIIGVCGRIEEKYSGVRLIAEKITILVSE